MEGLSRHGAEQSGFYMLICYLLPSTTLHHTGENQWHFLSFYNQRSVFVPVQKGHARTGLWRRASVVTGRDNQLGCLVSCTFLDQHHSLSILNIAVHSFICFYLYKYHTMTSKRDVLFTLPIGSDGQIVCFRPADRVYVIEFTSPPDNRLTTVWASSFSSHPTSFLPSISITLSHCTLPVTLFFFGILMPRHLFYPCRKLTPIITADFQYSLSNKR